MENNSIREFTCNDCHEVTKVDWSKVRPDLDDGTSNIYIQPDGNDYKYVGECENCGNWVEIEPPVPELVVDNVDVDKNGMFIQITDKVTNRSCWIEAWKDKSGEWEYDFNQYIFHLDNDNDVIAKMFQEDLGNYAEDVFDCVMGAIDEHESVYDSLQENKAPTMRDRLKEAKAGTVSIKAYGKVYYEFSEEEWNSKSEEEKEATIADTADQATDEEGHTVYEDEVEVITENRKVTEAKDDLEGIKNLIVYEKTQDIFEELYHNKHLDCEYNGSNGVVKITSADDQTFNIIDEIMVDKLHYSKLSNYVYELNEGPIYRDIKGGFDFKGYSYKVDVKFNLNENDIIVGTVGISEIDVKLEKLEDKSVKTETVKVMAYGKIYYEYPEDEWKYMSDNHIDSILDDTAFQATQEEGHTVEKDEVEIVTESKEVKTELKKGQTISVIYTDKDGNEKTTHFECDKNYDIDGEQIRVAIKSTDNDIDEIIKLEESKEVKTESAPADVIEYFGMQDNTDETFKNNVAKEYKILRAKYPDKEMILNGDFGTYLGTEKATPVEKGEYITVYESKKTEAMNGFNSENSVAQQLYDDFVEFEDIDEDKWNKSTAEERVKMVRPQVIKFYKQNRARVDDNWDDFMELLEYWNYHTEYKIFNDLAYDEILNVDESKKVTESKTSDMDTVDIVMELEGGELTIADVDDWNKVKSVADSLKGSQGFYGRLLRSMLESEEEFGGIENLPFPITM